MVTFTTRNTTEDNGIYRVLQCSRDRGRKKNESLFFFAPSLFLFLSLSHPPNKSRCYKILRERCQKTDISQLCSSKAAGVFLLLSYYCRKLIRQAVRRSVKSNLLFQVKYKEKGKNNASSSIYSQLPETTETQFAKQMSELQSEVSLHL